MTQLSAAVSVADSKARNALHDLAAELADSYATALEKRPTAQLALQKLINPVVMHILNTIFPWVVGVAVLFLILLICTVVTCFIVLRSAAGPMVAYGPLVAYGPAQ